MARIKKGILGGVSGKVGSVVGGSWNGIDYVRSLPTSFNQTQSALQLSHREKFRAVIRFLQPATDIVRLGFKSYANEMSAFNASFSWNYYNALRGDDANGWEVDCASARLSKGTLGVVLQPVLTPEANSVGIQWADNSGDDAISQAGDTLFYALFNQDKKESRCMLNAARRNDVNLSINLPAQWQGDTVHVLLGFIAFNALSGNSSRKSVSETVYAGKFTVL